MKKMEYDDKNIFTGEEFRAILRALSERELRQVLRATYRREGRKIVKMIAARTGRIGIRDGEKMARKSLRVYAYSRGGGFMVSANPRNKQGYYMTRQDREKPQPRWRLGHPVAMFLNGGSWKTHFVENGEQDALKMARRDIMDELQKTIQRRMGKMGIVMG